MSWCHISGVPDMRGVVAGVEFREQGATAVAAGSEGPLSVSRHLFSAVMRCIWDSDEGFLASRCHSLGERPDIPEWVDVVPAVHWTLNAAFRERFGRMPCRVMYAFAPRSSFRHGSILTGTSSLWKCC